MTDLDHINKTVSIRDQTMLYAYKIQDTSTISFRNMIEEGLKDHNLTFKGLFPFCSSLEVLPYSLNADLISSSLITMKHFDSTLLQQLYAASTLIPCWLYVGILTSSSFKSIIQVIQYSVYQH